MNENGTKKREWIKNAAIIFLIIMLILTFFSQTIMNYSLPQVAAQYIQSGTITAKIRGTGNVVSDDLYNVKIAQQRKVDSINVRTGDVVEQGAVLFLLSEKDSTELETAKNELETAKNAFELAILSGDASTVTMNSAGTAESINTYISRIAALRNEVEVAERNKKDLEAKVANIQYQIDVLPANNANVTEETKVFNTAKTNFENAGFQLTSAQNVLKAIESQIAYEESVSNGDSSVMDSLNSQKNSATQALNSAQTVYNQAELAFKQAETALENKKNSGDTTGTLASLNVQKTNAQRELTTADNKLTEKQENLATQLKDISTALNLDSLYSAVIKATAKVNELQEETQAAEVTAPVAGTIVSIKVKSGLETPEDGIVATMQPTGKGFTMSMTVTNEQAMRLSIGDAAELVNSWRYEDIVITISSIRPDPTNPGSNKLVVFNVSGNVVEGQALNVSVGDKSANYDMIIPNSAIREDNNGKFILIVESKSSPIGNRYIATRVDVEVLATDDTKSAISGNLYGSEFVITTSTAPIEAGMQVRLANN